MKSVWTMGEMIVEIMRPRAEMPHSKPDVYMGPYASGAPAIMISSAARMGAKSGIIGGVGQDAHGQMIVDRLEGCGVDCDKVLRSADKSTGNAFVMYHDDGSREFIFHIGGTAATACGVPDISNVTDPGYFHLMGCSLTADKDYCARILETAEAFRAKGAKFSFDPNIRPELLKGKIMDYYTEILEACDVLLTGKSELRFLFGQEWEDAVRNLLKAKDRLVVVKDGSRGTNFFNREEAFSVATYPATEVDPTGAGDCFDATFLSMVCLGYDYRTAVHYANAAGAHAVGKAGPMEGNTFKADLDAYLASAPKAAEKDIPMLY